MTPSDHSRNEDAPKPQKRAWHEIVRAPEWDILAIGLLMVVVHVFALLIVRVFSKPLFAKLLSVTGLCFFPGRAAAMLWGFDNDLNKVFVIVLVIYLETISVLAVFPLFVLAFKELVTFRPLLRAAARVRREASVHHEKVMKYGVPGLFLFVWFPFLMTGPLIGAVIGYFMGLRHTVNLTIVLLGTYVAIFCWGTVLRPLQEKLHSVHPAVSSAVVGGLIVLGVLVYARGAYRRRKRRTPPEGDSGGA